MAIYFILALALGAVTALILWQTLQRRDAEMPTATLKVYRQQLAELAQDVSLGKVPEAEASGIRAEIGRRLLAESASVALPATKSLSPLPSIFFALIVPVIAIPLYLVHGKPQSQDAPLDSRLENAIANNDLAAMVAQVEKRLGEKPGDAQGWTILAPIYSGMGRFADAAKSYDNLLRLEPRTADRYASLGEALTFAGEGIVSAEAARAFDQALKLDPQHSKSNFFMAITLKQEGRIQEARARFEKLLADAPSDAPWRSAVENQIASLAKVPALTDGQMQQGAKMTPAGQNEMIASMVNGLEEKLSANGDNIEGWLRLIRARMVLGEAEKAKASLVKATDIFKSDPEKLASINALAEELKL